MANLYLTANGQSPGKIMSSTCIHCNKILYSMATTTKWRGPVGVIFRTLNVLFVLAIRFTKLVVSFCLLDRAICNINIIVMVSSTVKSYFYCKQTQVKLLMKLQGNIAFLFCFIHVLLSNGLGDFKMKVKRVTNYLEM